MRRTLLTFLVVTDAFASTGCLASSRGVRRSLQESWSGAVGEVSGRNCEVYPALAEADPDRFGLSLVSTDGRVFGCGDARASFALMSVAKPFTFALVCAHLGADRAQAELGVNATGQGFGAVEPVLAAPGGRTNPMVNAGAIATCSRLPGEDIEVQWEHLLAGLSAFAGRELSLDASLYENVSATNTRNRELTAALESAGALAGPGEAALELYTRQSSLLVTAHDLAVMGATLANGGTNPVTARPVLLAQLCPRVLAVMATAGMYEHSGDWLYAVGLPAKSGIGGGIVTVAPGKAGVGAFSPRLDSAGNSVRGARATASLVRSLGLGLFTSRQCPPGQPAGDQ